ncbi:MAG: hypothetical protein KAX49_14385 [Halanaerobiales bacterium]|nr:hypothetical protein [Halanaerobiales bacterium]
MRFVNKVNGSDSNWAFKFKACFLCFIFCLSIFVTMPAYSAENDVNNSTQNDPSKFDSSVWLLTDIHSEDVNFYILEEPVVIDRHELKSKLKFFIESDSIKEWKLRIYDPETLESLLTIKGTAEDLGKPIEWDMNGESADAYYCMLSIFFKNENPKESKPLIFYINRKEEVKETASNIVDQPELNTWLINDIPNEELHIYVEQDSGVIDRHNLQNRLKLFISSNNQETIKEWRMKIYDPKTLDTVGTFKGTAEDLGKPIDWNLNRELVDEYFCMLTVWYSYKNIEESKPFIFYIERQEIKDLSSSADSADNTESDEIVPEEPTEGSKYVVSTDKKDYGFTMEQYFVVGFADLTVGKTYFQGNIEPVSEFDEFSEGIYVDGRFALYLKGKINGKYLLAAQIDTTEKPVTTLLENLNRKESSFILDNIDPDKYYPVYGDDSVSISEVDTEGKLYLKLEWDNSEILWGNYRISLNDTKVTNFNRTLYGARVHLENPVDTNANPSSADLFWAEALNLHSKDEIKSTGGSLYYLKNSDILTGSEKLSMEIKDSKTGQVVKSFPLESGSDYKIDCYNGRIILSKNLILAHELEELISKGESYLIAEYDFNPESNVSNSTYGFSGTQYLADDLRLNGRYLKERMPDGKSYQLYGIDGIYNFNENSYLTIEWANSGRALSGRFYSEDGGLTYVEIPELADQSNSNVAVLSLNVELPTQIDWLTDFNLGFNYNFYEKGFSTSKYQALNDINQFDIELQSKILDDYSVIAKYLYKDEKGFSKTSTASVQVAGNYNDNLNVAGELKYQNISEEEQEKEEILGAMRLDYQVNDNTTIYTNPRLTLMSNDDSKNNEIIVGTDMDLNDNMHVNLEGSTGTLGNNVKFSGDYDLTANNNIYGNVQYEVNNQKENKTTLLLGHKGNLTDTLNMYTEYQMANGTLENSRSGLIGLEYDPTENWSFFLDYTKRSIENLIERGIISREFLSGGVVYYSDELEYNTKLQLKNEEGVESLSELLLTNSAKWDASDEISLICNLDYSRDTAKSINGDFGIAYRPVEKDRFNLLGKYVFAANTSPEDMSTWNERYHIFSAEGIYDITDKWQIGEKVAYKYMKSLISENTWAQSKTYLWVNRLNYHIANKWDLSGEYRILHNSLAKDTKSGVLLAVYRYLNQNSKFGIGYNFTDFSDDLTDLSYQARGPFINLIILW